MARGQHPGPHGGSIFHWHLAQYDSLARLASLTASRQYQDQHAGIELLSREACLPEPRQMRAVALLFPGTWLRLHRLASASLCY
jgi:hypothetical protein